MQLPLPLAEPLRSDTGACWVMSCPDEPALSPNGGSHRRRAPSVRIAGLSSAPQASIQLDQIAAGYFSRERFLTELTLDPGTRPAIRPAPPVLWTTSSCRPSTPQKTKKSAYVLNVSTVILAERDPLGIIETPLVL
jgi:hypothetical protein